MTSFITPGEPRPKRDPYAKHDRQFEEAQAARKRRKARDKALSWEKAVRQVRAWTASSAVEALQAMPVAMQQMYLLAEELNHNRQEVLRMFPAVAPSTREVWSEVVSPPVAKTSTPRQKRKAS